MVIVTLRSVWLKYSPLKLIGVISFAIFGDNSFNYELYVENKIFISKLTLFHLEC